MAKKIKYKDRATITIGVMIVLIASVISVIFFVVSSFSLDKNLDSRTYSQLENAAVARTRALDMFNSRHFCILESMAEYISENGREAFIANASDLLIEAEDYIALGISDADGNAHCITCDESESLYEMFSNADDVLKKGEKAINMVGECGETPLFGFAVPVYKDGSIIGAVYAGVNTRQIEEVLYTVGFNNKEVVFIVDENGTAVAGDAKFNNHLDIDSISEYYNGDPAIDKISADFKTGKSGRFKATHDEQDFGVYMPVDTKGYSIVVTVSRSEAINNVRDNQNRYKNITVSLISTIIVVMAVAVWGLITNAKRMLAASKKELDREQHKETMYRNAITANCLGFFEVNLSDGIVTDMSGLKFKNDSLPDELRVTDGRCAPFDKFTEWICDNMNVEDKDEFSLLNSAEYLISCYEKNELMVETFFTSRVRGNIICRKVYYLYKDKFDDKIHALCIIHDVTEQINSEQEIKELIGEVREAKIRNSASQMQPHFLYNALASIREIILEDPQYASDLVYDFTTYLRACIRSMSSENFVPFSQELENIRAYTNIEKMRFGDRLKIETEIEETDFRIVPLSIQPLVENAIRHGIYQKGSEGGTVTIKTFKENGEFVIQVIDDGVGFDYEAVMNEIREGKRDSSGLENIKFRLNKLMNADVEIESESGKGTVVTVRTNIVEE